MTLKQIGKRDIINEVKVIETQKAERDIINVQGNLNLIGHDEGLRSKRLLNKFSRIDYQTSLDKNFNSKKTIKREQVILDIDELLSVENNILLYGSPGIGKSFLVTEIKKSYESVYISLKKRSEKEVLLYLLSKLLSAEEIENVDIGSIEDIKLELEVKLANTDKLFIFDDVEKMPHFVDSMINLEIVDNKCIFISRTDKLSSSNSICKYQLKGFTSYEVEEFIKENDIKIDIKSTEELIQASEGNPLYLYYYSHYQIKPLPRNLKGFQDALWSELESYQKGILALTSLPIFNLSFSEIRKSMEELTGNKISTFDFQSKLDELSHLLIRGDQGYSLFHLSLSEYIVNKLESEGTINEYRIVLGNIKIENRDFLEAVYLLIDVPKSKIKDIILRPLRDISELGMTDFGIKILRKAIELYNLDTEENIRVRGYSYHHLSNFYRDKYLIKESMESNEISIKYFEKIGDKNFLLNAKLYKAIDLLEIGRKEEADSIVEEIIAVLPDESYLKASICANLSKYYIDLSEYEESKKYALIAYKEFQNVDDFIKIGGVKQSLNNLSISYSFLKGDENLALSKKYGELLYGIARETGDIRTEVSISNLLTRTSRELKDFDEAYKYGKNAIKLAAKMRSNFLIILNTINLGNVYRDEKKYDKAAECYVQAKELAIQENILKEEVRALKLLVDIYISKDNLQLAEEIANEFLEKSKKLGIHYRISEAYDGLTEIHYMLDKHDWEEFLMKSLEVLFKEENYDQIIDTVLYAINFFSEKMTGDKINFYYELLLKSGAYKIELERVIDDIIYNKSLTFNQKLELLLIILKKEDSGKYLSRVNLVEFVEEVTKDKKEISSKKLMKVLDYLVESLQKEEFPIFFLIALIGWFKHLEDKDLKKILEDLSKLYKGFYYREVLPEELVITTSCSEDFKLQLICGDEKKEPVVLLILISTLFKFNWKMISEKIKEAGKNNYILFIDSYSNAKEHISNLEENQVKIEVTEEKPHFLGLSGNDIISIVINDDYEDFITLHKEKGRRGLLSLLLQLFMIIYQEMGVDYEISKKESIDIIQNLLLPPAENVVEEDESIYSEIEQYLKENLF